ncbi:MAG: hypothetical protein ACOCW3_05775 [Spirochaetota bacterium]
MTYGGYLLRDPFFWALLAGTFAGLALAAATSVGSRRVRAARDPRRRASRRWAYTWLALAGAVAAATLGILVAGGPGVPPGEVFLRIDSLYPAAAGITIAGIGTRFPRTGGVSVLLVVGAIAVLAAWSVRGFLPVRGERELGTITVLSMRDEAMTLEVQLDTPDAMAVPEVVAVEGRELRVVIDVLDVHPAFFLLGAERFVRYAGPVATSRPGPSSGLAPPLEWMLDRPGADLARLERQAIVAERVNLLRTYRIVVAVDGRPRLAVE